MSNRRDFLKIGLGSAAITLLPSVDVLAFEEKPRGKKSHKLRFVLASDGHYGQEGQPYDEQFEDLVRWLNKDHKKNHIDFAIINGDIVHDQPDLLLKVKTQYLDRFRFPYYAVHGNHDHADDTQWNSVFGYNKNFCFEREEFGFIVGDTASSKGDYQCPDVKFLKNSLEIFKNKAMVFVVLHIPPHQWLPEETFYKKCPESIELLHSYKNVKAVFHGHDHSMDGIRYTQKLPHLFDGHFGGNWGTTYRGFRIVEIDEQHKMSTYQVNGSMNPILNQHQF